MYIVHAEHGGTQGNGASDSSAPSPAEAAKYDKVGRSDVRAVEAPALIQASKRGQRTSDTLQSSKKSTDMDGDEDNDDASFKQQVSSLFFF